METALLAVVVAAVLSLFSKALQSRLCRLLHSRPALIWLAPALLTLVFCLAAGLARTLSPQLAILALAYTAAPVACAYVQGPGGGAGFSLGRPLGRGLQSPRGPGLKPRWQAEACSTVSVLDFLAILLLWLPLEFGAGASLIPRPAQGFLHSVAYGIAILLGLIVFLLFRSFAGMKYSLPFVSADLWRPLAAYVVLAPVLAILGVAIGFIPPPHAPTAGPRAMTAAFGLIFLGTALPEEILFRSLIQNLLMRRFGETTGMLVIASIIFGCAHLDNGPQPLPNWRYAILATIAGFAYGKVFQKSSSVCSSALLHMLVDWTKHAFF
jgi:membrane protease YdiL (CAAX protease family)